MGTTRKMHSFVLGIAAIALCGAAWGQTGSSSWSAGPNHPVLTLWPGEAPNATPAKGPEQDTSTAASPKVAGKYVARIGNVSTPTLTLYAPKGPNTGAAVVVFPGGGYSILAIDLEGTEVCDWLTSKGITCLILKYRVPGSGPYPKSSQALEDAQRAVGIVREHAIEWKIDPKKVGVLGFSAGGHLVAALSTHYEHRLYPAIDVADQLSCRPDFAIMIYPAYLAQPDKAFAFTPDAPVTKDTPPTILVQAEDDPVHVENSTAYFLALKGVGVPAEIHLYAKGGHGYGLRRTALPITNWPAEVETWLRTIGILTQ
ncbi:MAG: alpha/beta hydrolase [Granulicella sp.]